VARKVGESMTGREWETNWTPNFKKRCVWCWKIRQGANFREVSPIKRLEVCLDCEGKDPQAARNITKSEAHRLRRAMRGALKS
jgi:hypothetical protein